MKHLLEEMTLRSPPTTLLSNSPRNDDGSLRNDRTASSEGQAAREARRTVSKARKEQKHQSRKQQAQRQPVPSQGSSSRSNAVVGGSDTDLSAIVPPTEARPHPESLSGPLDSPMLKDASQLPEKVLYDQFNIHLRNPMVIHGSSSSPTVDHPLPPLPPESRLGSSRPAPSPSSVSDNHQFVHSTVGTTGPTGQRRPNTVSHKESEQSEIGGDDAKTPTSTVGFQFVGYFF